MTEHQKENLFVLTALYGGLLCRHQGPFLAQNSTFLRYTHITAFLWAQTDPTQWDHISPISFSVFFLTLLFNRNLATLALFPNGSPIKIVIVMYVHFYCLLNDRVPYFIFMSSAICGSAPRQC